MAGPADELLITRFEDIVLQRHLMQPRAEDRALIASGWILRYAVDSNVLISYVRNDDGFQKNPDRRAPIIGLGEIFRHDSEERKQDIAASLSYYIWHGLQPEAPLLMLPPIDSEFRHFINRVLEETAENAAKMAGTSPNYDEFGLLMEQIGRNQNSFSAEELRQLRHAILRDAGNRAVARRLRQVFARDRLRSPMVALDASIFDDEFRKAFQIDGRDLNDVLNFAQYREEWLDRLAKLRTVNATSRRDAEAMARLEICNQRLVLTRRRLVYITEDSSLLEAGETYLLGHNPDGSRYNFSHCFIRHPRAFLDEPGVLSPRVDNAKEGTSLTDWMDLLLGQFDGLKGIQGPVEGRVQLPENMKKTLTELSDTTSENEIKFDIDSRWTAYEATSSLDTPDAALFYLIRYIRTHSENEEIAVDQIKTAVIEARNKLQITRDERWEDLLAVSRANRLLLAVSAHSLIPVRDVPPSCFEGRPALVEFIRTAQTWFNSETEFSSESYLRSVDAVNLEDTTGYSAYLGHANLLAGLGHWRSAAILSLRAGEISAKNRENPVGPNGREARYLEACYRRYSARSKVDLEGLESLLDEAIAIYRDEVKIASEGEYSEWPHDAVPERFECEKLALDLTRLLFEWSSAQEIQRPAILSRMGELIPNFESKYFQLVDAVEHAELREPSAPLPSRVIDISYRSNIRGKLIKRVLVNIIVIGILHLGSRAKAEWAWLKLPNPDEDGASDMSQYSRFVWDCGAALFDTDKKRRATTRAKLARRRATANLEQLRMFPYDIFRFEVMVDRALGS